VAIEDRRGRERAARRRLIVTTARQLAQAEGWDAAFAELRQAVGAVADEHDVDALTEVFWAALHGLVTLTRDGRLRPGHDADRRRLLVNEFAVRQTGSDQPPA
jgi:hypothetical protein